MERAALVCERFAEMARGFEAREIVAVATSATREAENQHEFLDLVQERAGIRLRVISGIEEARLIYLGVSRGTHLDGQSALFIDIGGGSTEMAVGDLSDFAQLESVKIGAIRVAQRFGLDQPDPVSRPRYEEVKHYIRSETLRSVERLKRNPWQRVVASSGTTRNLARVERNSNGKKNSHEDPIPVLSGITQRG
jgi:exopolyphosphatase/guanosine-5'-triphosphate,3'-diphosphate pyrophosphatase